jgi:5-methylcytosine-specific restriction protein A
VFEPGRLYPRNQLHREWDGDTALQPQGGILTPREVPLVIVVTGEEGSRYGYADFWDEAGVFHYYGAGQEGDMEFVRGNLALRDHALNGEELHLFESERRRGLRYVGAMVCAGFYERDGVPDRNGELRRAIVFELVALDEALVRPDSGDEDAVAAPAGRWAMDLAALRQRL